MECFKDNRCRICKSYSCCKPCREKHETNKHNIFPECDICLYGKIVIKNPSSPLLMHLQVAHWPLHCVICKKVFGSTEELLRQCKCPKRGEDIENNPYSPLQSYNEHTYESPPFSALCPNERLANKNPNLFSSLATSTPMQKGEHNLLEKMQGITPVDYSEINKESIIKKTRLHSNRSGSPKKVTFCDTPLAESNKKQKEISKKGDIQNEGSIYSTPSILCGTFYSVAEETPQDDAEIEEINKESNDQPQNEIDHKNEQSNRQPEYGIPAILITYCDAKIDDNEQSNHQSQEGISTGFITNADAADSKAQDKPDKKNTPIKQEDSTTWLSAIDISPSEGNDEKKTSPKTNLYTPVATTVGKFKKRQVNVVLPTPAVKQEEVREVSITIDMPLPLFPTDIPFKSDSAKSGKELPVTSKPNSSIVSKSEVKVPSPLEMNEDFGNENLQENSDTENQASLANSKNGIERDTAASAIHRRLWSFMSKVTSAIGQGFSSVDESMIHNAQFSLKRSFTDSELLDEPPAKRQKLTEIRCRRTIRNLPNIEIIRDNTRIIYAAHSMKVLVDKETQTDE